MLYDALRGADEEKDARFAQLVQEGFLLGGERLEQRTKFAFLFRGWYQLKLAELNVVAAFVKVSERHSKGGRCFIGAAAVLGVDAMGLAFYEFFQTVGTALSIVVGERQAVKNSENGVAHIVASGERLVVIQANDGQGGGLGYG